MMQNQYFDFQYLSWVPKWILKCFLGNSNKFNVILITCESQWLLPVFNLDMMKLRQAKEENERLNVENKSLQERIRTMGSEKKDFQQQVCMSGMAFSTLQSKPMQSLVCCYSWLAFALPCCGSIMDRRTYLGNQRTEGPTASFETIYLITKVTIFTNGKCAHLTTSLICTVLCSFYST